MSAVEESARLHPSVPHPLFDAWPFARAGHLAWVARVLAMVEIEEEENLSELSVTQLKKRMKERGIEASGCTEVTGTPTLLAHRASLLQHLAPQLPEQKADLIKRLESPGKHQRKGGGATSSAPTTAVEAAEAPEESPMAQLGAVGRQLVLLPVLWTSNKVDWEVPSNVIMLRVAFGVVLVIVRRRQSQSLHRHRRRPPPPLPPPPPPPPRRRRQRPVRPVPAGGVSAAVCALQDRSCQG